MNIHHFRYVLLFIVTLSFVFANENLAYAARPIQEADPCEGLVQEGMGLYSQKQVSEALQKFEEVLSCYREQDDRAGEARNLYNMGFIYSDQAKIDLALSHYEQALTIFREIGEQANEAAALSQIGFTYDSQAQYEKALSHYEQALTIYRQINNRAGEAQTLSNIGSTYSNLGNYEEALSIGLQALEIRQEISEESEWAPTLNNIGFAYNRQGQYEEALKYYKQVLNIVRESGDHFGEGVTLNNIAGVYDNLGEYEEALSYYKEALALAQNDGHKANEATILNNIGFIYTRLGKYDQARNYYEQALPIYQEIGDRNGEGVTLNNIGRIKERQGRYPEALDDYDKVRTIVQDIGDKRGEGVILNNIGLIYYYQGQYKQALEHYQKALKIRQEIGHRFGERISLTNIALAYEGLGQYEEALNYYKLGIDVIEQVRGDLKVEEFKSSFTSEQVDAYQNIIDLLIRMERPEEAFHYVQQAKARTFLDQLGNVRVNPLNTENPQLTEEEQMLRDEIQDLDNELSQEWAKPKDLRSNEVIKSLTTELEQKRNAYKQLLARLKLENPEYASLLVVDTLTLTEVQQVLTDTTLVEYYVLPEQTLAFVVTSDSFHIESISVTQEMLIDEISSFHRQTRGPLDALEGVPTTLDTLYDLLIVPIEDQLNSNGIIIAPHNILYYVPFAALHHEEGYFIEKHVLSQLSSASFLPFILNKRKDFIGKPLILGDAEENLLAARQEAEAVASKYNTTAYLGDKALEQLVWELGPNAGIVHIASHGTYNPISPLFSRVSLASSGEGKYDGLLEVREVYNLNLHNATLVTLSACETNLPSYAKLREGVISVGDDIVGLNQAFIYAGTPSILATLWRVEDNATKHLMVAFYNYFDQGYSKGEALRQAQLEVLQNSKTAHPYFWAGFVLTGDMGELKPTPDRTWLWISATLLMLILLIVGGGLCIRNMRRTNDENRIG